LPPRRCHRPNGQDRLAELPDLERLADELRDDGLVVVAVCQDQEDPEEVGPAARKHVARLPVYVDPRGAARLRYAADVVPSAYLIGPDGRLLGHAEGAREWPTKDVRDLLRRLERVAP
jgi:hypothetical protein